MGNVSIIHSIDRNAASLPEKYEEAKTALSTCYSVDECKSWADKAQALASYAKQADDDELEMMAKRIRGRAIRQMGILLSEFDARADNSRKQINANNTLLSKKEVANNAGLSKRRTDQATRLANISDQEFEEMIERVTTPTIKELEQIGTKTRPSKVHPKQGMRYFQSAYLLAAKVGHFHKEIMERPEPSILLESMMEEDLEEIKRLWSDISSYMNEIVK